MPIKCESCKHQRIWLDKPVCDQPSAVAADLESSRLICDREGDGHFVYFEPKTPTAGAAFAATAEGRNTTSSECVPEPAWPEDWLEDAINHFLTAVAGGAQ